MFSSDETKDVATKEQIANIPIIKNKIEKSQEIVLNNQEIIDGHISLSAMFPIPKENLAAFIMNDNSMSGAGFLMQDILFIDTRSCGLDDDAYLFVQNFILTDIFPSLPESSGPEPLLRGACR